MDFIKTTAEHCPSTTQHMWFKSFTSNFRPTSSSGFFSCEMSNMMRAEAHCRVTEWLPHLNQKYYVSLSLSEGSHGVIMQRGWSHDSIFFSPFPPLMLYFYFETVRSTGFWNTATKNSTNEVKCAFKVILLS